MQPPLISALHIDDTVEVVERKGIGHPDTICDALAETLSHNLCREYRRRFGRILHYNVDKALLCGGRAAPAFRGGTLLAPIGIYLAGRATTSVGTGDDLSIRDIAIEGSRYWLHSHLRALDAERHVQLHALIHPGSQDLQDLFSRRGQEVPLANDTSIGVGHAPASPLERLVLAVEQHIQQQGRDGVRPAWGEDVKVMGIRSGGTLQLTVACAMIGRYLTHIDDYIAEKSAMEKGVADLAAQHGFPTHGICVNAGDDLAASAIYLTVTGTSAEAGDDGQVGRGNRVNGLITPCRPMSLEAAAGKNPITHVGKIYNVVARQIAERLVADVPDILAAQCLLVSRIGSPVTSPAIAQIKLATRDGIPVEKFGRRVEEIVADRLHCIPTLIDDFVDGTIGVF